MADITEQEAFEEMIEVGRGYHAHDQLTTEELWHLSALASEQFCTMNGDAGN